IYATRPHPRGASRAKIPTADAALIASPSAFQGLIQRSRLIPSLPLITMGPTTSAAVEAAGYPVAAEAPSPNVEGLLAAYRELAREEAGRTEKAR
ncbi:MAG: uroporphyrinogen-III synthase, partial [Acidobacteriota bacterium]